MNVRIDPAQEASALALYEPINESRRRFLAGTAVVCFGAEDAPAKTEKKKKTGKKKKEETKKEQR